MSAAAITEWTYHKTGDHLHPDGSEQQLVWLLNRARANPAQEGVFLAGLNDAAVAAARSYFHVDTGVLRAEFAGYAAKPPAAFDVRLYQAAKAHSDYLIGSDAQNHNDQFLRIQNTGFHYGQAAGIVYSYSKYALYGHAGFNIDWGEGSDGTQDPPGHRLAIMSVNADYTHIGYAAVSESDPGTEVGPQVITGNLCNADTRFPDHYNRFLVGTVWSDANGNDRYDPGEGIAGVRVQPDKGNFYAVTANAGGYALPMTADGALTVAFSGGTIITPVTRSVSVGGASVLLDLEYTLVASSAAAPLIGVFRPTTGAWTLDEDGDGAFGGCSTDGCYSFGKKRDLPVTGDWDGDGASEIGVYRPKKQTFFLDRNSDNALGKAKVDPRFRFAGAAGDEPVSGDWTGTGRSAIGLFRPATGGWFLDLNGNGVLDDCDDGGCPAFGASGDLPAVADWDGDGRDDLGVFRPATGGWFVDLDGDREFNDCAAEGCYRFGANGDRPVVLRR